jgi:hypothetical protein
LYCYTFNNPINSTDPFGLACWNPFDWIMNQIFPEKPKSKLPPLPPGWHRDLSGKEIPPQVLPGNPNFFNQPSVMPMPWNPDYNPNDDYTNPAYNQILGSLPNSNSGTIFTPPPIVQTR